MSPSILHPLQLIPLVSLLISVLFTGWVAGHPAARRSQVHRSFLVFTCFVTLWIGSDLSIWVFSPLEKATSLYRILSITWLLLGWSFLRFAFRLTATRLPIAEHAFLGLAAIAWFLALSTDLVFRGSLRVPWGIAFLPGPLHAPFAAITVVIPAVVGLSVLVVRAHWDRDRGRRNTLLLITSGAALTLGVAGVSNVFLPDVLQRTDVFQIGPSAAIGFWILAFLALEKYNRLRNEAGRMRELSDRIFSPMDEGFLVTDPSGVIVETNREALRHLALPSDGIGIRLQSRCPWFRPDLAPEEGRPHPIDFEIEGKALQAFLLPLKAAPGSRLILVRNRTP